MGLSWATNLHIYDTTAEMNSVDLLPGYVNELHDELQKICITGEISTFTQLFLYSCGLEKRTISSIKLCTFSRSYNVQSVRDKFLRLRIHLHDEPYYNLAFNSFMGTGQ